jgi:putative ABC transport system substrate-binding protein
LELMNEILPRGATIGYLYDPNFDFSDVGRRNVETAARTIGREVRIVEARKDADLEKGFARLTETHVGGVVIAASALTNNLPDHLLALTTRLKLPAVHESREFVLAGGLMYSSRPTRCCFSSATMATAAIALRRGYLRSR